MKVDTQNEYCARMIGQYIGIMSRVYETQDDKGTYIWALTEARNALTSPRFMDNTPLETLWRMCEKYAEWANRNRLNYRVFSEAADAVADLIEWLLKGDVW